MYFFLPISQAGKETRGSNSNLGSLGTAAKGGGRAGKSLDLCCLCLFSIGSQLTQAGLEHTASPRASEIAGSHLRDSGPSLVPGSGGAHRRYEATRRRQRPGEARMSGVSEFSSEK